MKLREFGLELRGEDGSATVQFRTETRCVTSLYERCFEGLRTDKSWKVLVECGRFLAEGKPPVDQLGVAMIQVDFDWDAYRGESDRRKKEMALAALQDGVLSVCAEWGWSREPFERAHRQVLDLNFVNRGVWKKPKLSPDRKFKAEIEIEYEIDRFMITMVIRDHKGCEVKREQLVEETPNEFVFDKHLGELTWLSTSDVALVPKRGEGKWIVSVE